jgi:nucleotidyltransferase substrate binding protein (TIGR01987 family)
MNDVRWKQRFANFQKAFQTLVDAVALANTRRLSNLEEQGMIQRFAFTHELAWNVLKDYLEHQGFTGVVGSRDATRLAFKNGLIEDGEAWMAMIEDRNRTTHTYNEDTAREVVDNVRNRFFPAFEKLSQTFAALSEQPDDTA